MAVRAKFHVTEYTDRSGTRWNDDGSTEQVTSRSIVLLPVVSGSPENKQFYTNTPSGRIELTTVNMAAAEQFQLGKAYYIDFTPAD